MGGGEGGCHTAYIKHNFSDWSHVTVENNRYVQLNGIPRRNNCCVTFVFVWFSGFLVLLLFQLVFCSFESSNLRLRSWPKGLRSRTIVRE